MSARTVDDLRLDDAPLALASGLLDGRTAIVSGGGSGIGKAAAWVLARLGARVAICGRNPERLKAVQSAFDARGWPILAQPCDIRDEAGIERLLDAGSVLA